MSTEKIKICFLGTPEFAVAPLASLIIDPSFEIQAVITQEDKKVGRKQIVTAPPVKDLALKKDIPVFQPPNINKNPEITELIKDLSPDFIVVVAYGQIIPDEIISIPKYGCINIHASLLPFYRGASPIEESILNGDKTTGVTFMKIVKKLDAGPIYHIEKVKIEDTDTSVSLREKLSLVGSSVLPYVLKDIVDEITYPIEQDESKASYCHKISKNDGLIDPAVLTAEEIKNRIRAFTPWPSCFLLIKDKKIKLIDIEIDSSNNSCKANDIIWLSKNQIAIGTKKGVIIPKTIQLEGKKEMPIQDFLLGNKDLFTKLLASDKNTK